MAMRPWSLHARLLLMSVTAIVLALAIAGWTISGLLERMVTQGLDRRLDAEVSLLASTVGADGQVDRTLLGQRIGALESDPGWRWQIAAPGSTIGDADVPIMEAGPRPPLPHDRDEPAPGPPDLPGVDRLHPIDGETHGGMPVHARQLTLETPRGVVVITASAPRDVVERPVREVLVPLLVMLAVLAALLGVATVLQLRWGLRPLRRLRDQVAAIRSGARDRVEERQPSELRPLASELNQLAEDNAAALASARLSSANLAHALKTPVATLALSVRDEPERAAQVARIDATIRHHLARARVTVGNRRSATPLAQAVSDIAEVVRRLNDVSIETDIGQGLIAAVDMHDLNEMIGNLLDNAARHGGNRIRVSAIRDPDDARRIRIEVTDNGPGIPVADRLRVMQPGIRLDERGGEGHGFGLAIVSDLVSFYGGLCAFDHAANGGLRVRLAVPAVVTAAPAEH